MTTNHRAEAERLASRAHHFTYGDGGNPTVGQALATEAVVHALLADKGVDPAEHQGVVDQLAALNRAIARFIYDNRGHERYADGVARLHTALVDEAGLDLGGELDKLLFPAEEEPDPYEGVDFAGCGDPGVSGMQQV
ncbi:hypothetical protein [Peterkaempfera sp. SMS 1(5)a]|uniref:hypothetical protein n=1 Tax=Peterkaempfera podocarpi TaxID=3232308 RepID=UPI00366D9066